MAPRTIATNHGELLGRGWGRWRGSWSSETTLEDLGSSWIAQRGGVKLGSWSSFSAAIAALWSERQVRNNRPWAIGFLSYETCADFGGLASHRSDDCLPRALWMLEPEPEPFPDVHPYCPVPTVLDCSLNDNTFKEGVASIRESIEAGKVYQVNLTRQFRVRPWRCGLDTLMASATLGGEPDYLSRMRWDGGEVLCASMELLARKRGREVETRPIKGTRPRGLTLEQDRRLALELATDEKELAELAMIVDLERNDLGRIARAGSVRISDPGRVSSYPGLHHRSAAIVAEVKDGIPWWEVVETMAPGGSVTGCPKVAAAEVIKRLERVARGPYTGALGVIAGDGDFELALPIRTAWCASETLYFAAGCGIVWQSDPAAEEQESRLKVERWLELVQ